MTPGRAAYALFVVLALSACRTPPREPDRVSPQKGSLTFNRDIAPIVFARCSPCHRPGQAVPFVMLGYEDVRSHARKIAAATAHRHMPPWLPEPGFGDFVGERRLPDAQIQMIQQWVAEGAVEGAPAALPALPAWTNGWQLGQPDAVVSMPRAYTLAADGPNVFRNFVLPVSLPAGRFVRAVEFRSNNPGVVHHAVITLDRTRASRRRDGSDGSPGFAGMFAPGSESPEGRFLGWTPGRGPIVEPADMAWRLERGSDLVVQLHLLPSGKPEPIQVSVGLFFTETPPARVPMMIRLGSKAIDIPAGEKAYTISDSYVLPMDVEVLSVYPHAHYLATEMRGIATLPDGRTQWLMRINHWDFHWQQDYRFRSPIALPRGTTVSMQYTYDNSDANPDNPHHPPHAVTYGPQSVDEMGDLWLQVLPHTKEDAAVLARDFAGREALANVAGGEMLVRVAPDVAENHVFLASGDLQVGRIDEAIDRLAHALRLAPRNASAHNYLGGALMATGHTAEAIAHFRAAVAIDPRDDGLHFNLANALNAGALPDEATRELRRAIAINPDSAEAQNNLGVLLGSRSQLEEAAVHLEQAVSIKPEYAEAHNNLGAMLARMGRLDEAIRHIRRALEIRPEYVEAQNNLRMLLTADAERHTRQ
jgi:tetratricopeptide (TPR) repeat protein